MVFMERWYLGLLIISLLSYLFILKENYDYKGWGMVLFKGLFFVAGIGCMGLLGALYVGVAVSSSAVICFILIWSIYSEEAEKGLS